MKIRYAIALAILTALVLTGCGKVKLPSFGKKEATPVAGATPAPGTSENPSATASGTADRTAGAPEAGGPAPAVGEAPGADPKPAADGSGAIDKTAQVVVLCYHRLEGKAGGALSIEPALFRSHMQELKSRGLAVIPMEDFLAWQRSEKSIPAKSVVITIDDGYVSGLEVGVPILKEFGYSATFYVYLDYINKGGKSVTWAQLGKLRDEGFDIGSHTVSHQDLRRKPRKTEFATHEEWLKDEVGRSKQTIEEQLGIRVTTIAYPFGNHNPTVHAAVKAAGYDAGFTTYGQRIGHGASPFSVGRYDVTAKDAQGNDGFTAAISFQGPAASSGPVMAQEASALMITEPMNDAVTNNPKPTLKANLASLGAVDPASIEMRVSGIGIVPASFDAASKNISYTLDQPLRPGKVTVIIKAKAKGNAVETRWSFTFDPKAQPSNAAADSDLPPRR